MKRIVKILAIVLLIFLGFGGVYGAWMLISDPSGGKFNWPLDLLNGTPFKSYLIPGIVLLVSNGLLPLYIAIVTISRKKYASWLITLQGSILIGWLTAELMINPEFFVPEMEYSSSVRPSL
jgi:hypothetical protein